MYHPVRRKCYWQCIVVAFIVTICVKLSFSDKINSEDQDEDLDNNIIDFDSKYDTKYNSRDTEEWRADNFKKDAYRYSVHEDSTKIHNEDNTETSTNDYLNVVPLELVTVTEEPTNIIQTTTDIDLTVIPLSTTQRVYTTPSIITTTLDTVINYTTTDKSINNEDIITTESEHNVTTTTNYSEQETTTKESDLTTVITDTITDVTSTTQKIQTSSDRNFNDSRVLWDLTKVKENRTRIPKRLTLGDESSVTSTEEMKTVTETSTSTTESVTTTIKYTTKATINKQVNSTNSDIIIVSDEPNSNRTNKSDITDGKEDDVPIFTELDLEDDKEVPEDYYDSKDVVPTKAPNTDALSVIFGLAGSVVESVAERVVPKGIFDLFKRMQKQNEALEAERLRSREENGGIGQFGRGILKSISSGISRPFTQLMSARDIGSLDNDRGFVASVANGVSNVANVATSLGDAFKNRVQAIYPGTLWCGDGHSAQARSSDLGLFFFTDTCCRQHDACKIYIRAGDTKYGLTNTGVFTRSHCSCDARFRECLRKTNSLVSSQIGLTYFNVLGPQCFRKAHPIVRCVRKTRLTGQKCEEYELDYTKPKMWQWFDNETF